MYVATAALGVALFAYAFARPPLFLAATLHTFARPFWYAQARFSSGASVATSIFDTKAALLEENDALLRKVTNLEDDLADDRALERENANLKAMLNRKPADIDAVLAYVLGKPGKTPYDTLILDVGLRDGVKPGDAVLAGENRIIGEMVDVFRASSKARLFSSPKQTVDVLVGEGAFPLTAYGLGNGSFAIEVPRGLSVAEGDTIYLPGNPPSFFGTVETIGSAAADPVKVILFRSPVNIAELKWVMVGRGMPARLNMEEGQEAQGAQGVVESGATTSHTFPEPAQP
jgi:cell shape-determining protein MreC